MRVETVKAPLNHCSGIGTPGNNYIVLSLLISSSVMVSSCLEGASFEDPPSASAGLSSLDLVEDVFVSTPEITVSERS